MIFSMNFLMIHKISYYKVRVWSSKIGLPYQKAEVLFEKVELSRLNPIFFPKFGLSRLNPISVGRAKIVPKSLFAGFSISGLSRLNPHF